MVRNNHFNDHRRQLDRLLRADTSDRECATWQQALGYARSIALLENVMVVVSDMADRRSHIISGGFASQLGLAGYNIEDSIWEHRILSLMSPAEQEGKYIAELRFYHYLKHIPRNKKPEYYMMSKLRLTFADGSTRDVLHRMYYLYDNDNDSVRYAVCTYGPLSFEFSGKSLAVNSVTGVAEELTSGRDDTILSRRQRQVLSLIDAGLKSAEIASRLNVSIHTVSRHRQDILDRLQVKNSHEACRLAKQLSLL